MELSFPIEFLVHGTAVSLQAKRAESRAEWKERVKEASKTVIPQPHFASDAPISVTLYSRHIYLDDHQVERLIIQKFEPGFSFMFTNPTETFASALGAERPVLYVRLSDKPMEDHQ
jgi:crossover junction endodeoxyribonuclease RusA